MASINFKNLKRVLLITVFFFISKLSNAQLADTISYSLKQKPKYFATLASFNTFIDRHYTHIFRIKTGLAYNQRVRFGVGLSTLTNQVVSKIHIDSDNLSYDTDGELSLSFVSVSGEYYFYNAFPWQFTITPVDLGIGGAHYKYVNRSSHKLTNTPSETIILYQPEVSAQYSIFTWFGVGLTTGYRFTLLRSKKATLGLNAPSFAIDFRLFLDEIYKGLFEKDNSTEN